MPRVAVAGVSVMLSRSPTTVTGNGALVTFVRRSRAVRSKVPGATARTN
jgi:hypothetical protein